MLTNKWDEPPTPNGAVLVRATNAISALSKGEINLNQFTPQQRSALFAPVPNSLQAVLGWFRQYDTTPPFNQDHWAMAIYPAYNVVDGLMAKLIVGESNVPGFSIEIIQQAIEALGIIYNNAHKQLFDDGDEDNARDPIFWDYSQDLEYVSNLLMAIKDYLSRKA